MEQLFFPNEYNNHSKKTRNKRYLLILTLLQLNPEPSLKKSKVAVDLQFNYKELIRYEAIIN